MDHQRLVMHWQSALPSHWLQRRRAEATSRRVSGSRAAMPSSALHADISGSANDHSLVSILGLTIPSGMN
jgi:hypothetical protein